MFEAPFPPYDPSDKSSFSYETVVKRWPVIITSVIDTVYRNNHDIAIATANSPSAEIEEKLMEGKTIIEAIAKLKYEMGRDRPLEPIPHDGEAMGEVYNAELTKLKETGRGTWFTAPWLFAECYLYRLIRSHFALTRHWKIFDPFAQQKESTFQASGMAIYKLATMMHQLEDEKAVLESDPNKLEIIFREMVQMCLWGNATDLSLLTHMSHEDIQRLQAVGKEAQKAQKEFILKDDQDAVWSHIKTLQDARVDFVLDNAGFEVFTDFLFADFLVTYTPYVSRVIFHPKSIPWFVSDVTPPDFERTPEVLLSPAFFAKSATETTAKDHLHALVSRWKRYIAGGIFRLSVPLDAQLGVADPQIDFWTSPWPYWNMQAIAPKLFEDLMSSGLVIFKGDLNYRKLTGDVRWPVDTPFETAVGPLSSSFPLLSLRTNKADVVVGVPKNVASELDVKDPRWAVNGKYALVSFLRGRAASTA